MKENSGKGDVYRFTSSNEEVVTVDSVSGHAKTVGEGDAVITVKSMVSGRSDACQVTVKKGYVPDAEGVELSCKFSDSVPVFHKGNKRIFMMCACKGKSDRGSPGYYLEQQ